ncbi:universal stress protein [Corynebacterium guangdongense]|uniref:Nucleotide-binding universal stress UspA family protein n=1 Tax=Corynebacterium guangdongense TaxID=1783348 RepID=A0ABU2A0B8_9CORY|nr:universal stress protein [Corynebacterium guangdongense]MDR7330535.1 nucleotide-binding universal stress UspA family protein [Corynebacterium guangdongense]WJZ19089.1 Universal stress protein family protein [Corynebacterium guangdongense]
MAVEVPSPPLRAEATPEPAPDPAPPIILIDPSELMAREEQPPTAPGPIRLLVAIEPGGSDTEAINFAVWLSRTAPVKVRAVGTFQRPWPISGLSKMAGRYEEWLQRQSAKYAKQVAKTFRNAGLEEEFWDDQISTFVDGPSEATLLCEAADDFNADLIILASTPAAPKGRFTPGTSADALLHSSPHHLGLVPRAAKLSKRGVTRLNFALLESDHQRDHDALMFTADLAAQWEVPLRVLAFSPMGLTDANDALRLDLHRDVNDEWHEYALSMLDRVRDSVLHRHESLDLDTGIAAGGGWSGAHGAVKWKKGDLLMLGSQPVGAFSRVFVGSTEAEFIRHARVPVVVSAPKAG